MNTLFILSESIDEGIIRMWHFPVANKYEMACYIIDHIEKYDDQRMFRGVSWFSGLRRWRDGSDHTPEDLLKAIEKSHIDGDSESGFEIHRFDLSDPIQYAEDDTWTSDKEMAELQALARNTSG